MLQPPSISQPAPPTPASPAQVQKYNQIRQALGLPPKDGKDVFQITGVEGFVRRVTLSDNPKDRRRKFSVTLNQETGALLAIRSDLDSEALHKQYKEGSGPLLFPQAREAILSSLLPFSLPEEDRKNWETVRNYTPLYDDPRINDDPLYYPESYIQLRRRVDNKPVILSQILLIADAQRGQVSHYTYEEGIPIPQVVPLVPEPVTRAMAQKLFLEAGGSPKAKCNLQWDTVAWWPAGKPLCRLTYWYEFELKKDNAPEDEMGAIWSVPIDAQTGEFWWIHVETGGGGPNIPPVATRSNPYFQRIPFASDSPDTQKLAIAAMSIPKLESAMAPEKFSTLTTPKRKVYYSWDPKQSKLVFSVDPGKDWFGGILPEKAARPFMEWLKTQPATPSTSEKSKE